MTVADLIEVLDYNRQKTIAFIDNLAKQENVQQILAFRPGPGRASISWQLMHIAATDDRHVHVRVLQGQSQQPNLVERFGVGSKPDDNTPTLAEIRQYLDSQRQELLSLLKHVEDSKLNTKPNDQMPWTYSDWLKTLAWHEAHHHGQAHLTFNIYKATQGLMDGTSKMP